MKLTKLLQLIDEEKLNSYKGKENENFRRFNKVLRSKDFRKDAES